MDRETIQRLLRSQPFVPFELLLSSGQTVRVGHPENAVLSKAQLIVVDPSTDAFDIVALLQVTQVHRLQAA